MTILLRRVFLVVTPLALAVVLWWHPPGGENIYEGLRDDVGAWMFVHTAFLLFTPLIAIAAYLMLGDLKSRAATVSRVALVFFLVFYTAYEVTVESERSPRRLRQRAARGRAGCGRRRDPALQREHHPRRSHVGLARPRFFGWVVAMLAAAVAFRRSGAGWPVTLLVGFAAVFAVHPPPVGPVGLVCFAAAAVLIERARAREDKAVALYRMRI